MAVKDEPIANVTQYNLGFLIYIIPSLHQIMDAQVSNFSQDTLKYNMVGGGGESLYGKSERQHLLFNNNSKCWR